MRYLDVIVDDEVQLFVGEAVVQGKHAVEFVDDEIFGSSLRINLPLLLSEIAYLRSEPGADMVEALLLDKNASCSVFKWNFLCVENPSSPTS